MSKGDYRFVFIGAGSGVFTRRLVADILCEPSLAGGTIALMDVDETRLNLISRLVRKMIRVNKCDMKVVATTNRKEALEGADFVINTIHVGGVEVVRADFDIPAKHGLRQTIADTTGPGGIFRFIRVAPVIVDIVEDMERLCPDALFLNYTNPMCMNMSVVQAVSKIRSIGLCHSVQNVARHMAEAIGMTYDEVVYSSAGVNHMAWFYRFEDGNGNNLYPALRAAIKKDPGCLPPIRRLNADLLLHFGLFPTEGTNHLAEYLPYYLKSKREAERLGIKVNAYLDHWGARAETHDKTLRKMLKEPETCELKPSFEYASRIIRAFATNQAERVHGSFMNTDLMPPLPKTISVEIPVYVDRQGFSPVPVPADGLPPGPLALTQALVGVYDCAVRGYLAADRELIAQAVQLDPNVAMQLTLPKIRAMVKEMFRVNEAWLREYGSNLARKSSARKRSTRRKQQ